MKSILSVLSRLQIVNVRGVFATLFAVELREAMSRDKRYDEGAYLWG